MEENCRVNDVIGSCCLPGCVGLGVSSDTRQGVRAKGAKKDCACAREASQFYKHCDPAPPT